MIDLQALVDGMSQQWQKERAETQLTLGKLIDALKAMPPGAQVANLHKPHSYRGYYDDLAFEIGEATRSAKDLLAECQAAMGEVFIGYKGGEFVMGRNTPLWVASYSRTGKKLMSVAEGGEYVADGEDD